MFDELDGDRTFVPSPSFRAGVERRARRLRRRGRLLRAAAVVVALGAVTAGGVALAVQRRDAAIDRVDVVTNPSVDGAVNVLVLGTDRDGRADTSVVVRFAPEGPVSMLTIPRDLWVPGDDGGERLGAVARAGPDAYVAALARVTGLPVDHVVQLGFDGFRDLVDAVGGLRVGIGAELRDRRLGLHLEPAECATLDGEVALQLVRARSVEVRRDGGDFVPDPAGDLGRRVRGQALAAAALAQLTALDPDAARLADLSEVLADHAVLDDGLDLARIVELGRRLLDAGSVSTAASLPVRQQERPDGSVVLERAGGDDLLRGFGAVDPPPAEGDAAASFLAQRGGPSTGLLAPCVERDPTSTTTTAPPRRVVVVSTANGVLGGWDGSRWMESSEALTHLRPDVAHRFVRLGAPTSAGRMTALDLDCSPAGELTVPRFDPPLPDEPGAVAVTGDHDLLVDGVEVGDPRSDTATREAIGSALTAASIEDPVPALSQLLRFDVDGDGTVDDLAVAERRTGGPSLREASAGDYSAVVRRLSGDGDGWQVGPLAVAEGPAREGSLFLDTFRVTAAADLDGDGTREVVLHSEHPEGSSDALYGRDGSSPFALLGRASCAL